MFLFKNISKIGGQKVVFDMEASREQYSKNLGNFYLDQGLTKAKKISKRFGAGLMFLPAKINFDQPAVEIGSNWYKLVLTG